MRPAKNECSVDLDKAERKRNRKRSRKCKQITPTQGKTVNDLTLYLVAAFAIAISLFISSLCNTQQGVKSPTVSAQPSVQQAQTIPVSGEWQMEATQDQTTTFGVVFLKQDNAAIYGKGQDPAGAFTLDGKLWSNRIWFVKRYDEEACLNGANRQDIVFDGMVSNQSGSGLVLDGKFETQMKSGFPTSYFQKTQWQKVSGRWCARKIGALPAEMSLQMDSRRSSWNPLRDLDAQPKNQQQPTMPVTETQTQNQMVAYAFYSILAVGILFTTGWIVFLVCRYLQRWCDSFDAEKSRRARSEEPRGCSRNKTGEVCRL